MTFLWRTHNSNLNSHICRKTCQRRTLQESRASNIQAARFCVFLWHFLEYRSPLIVRTCRSLVSLELEVFASEWKCPAPGGESRNPSKKTSTVSFAHVTVAERDEKAARRDRCGLVCRLRRRVEAGLGLRWMVVLIRTRDSFGNGRIFVAYNTIKFLFVR